MAHAFVYMAGSSSLSFLLAFHALKTTGMIILGADCTKDKGCMTEALSSPPWK